MAFGQDYIDFCTVEVNENRTQVLVHYNQWGGATFLDGIPTSYNDRVLWAHWVPNQQIEVGIGPDYPGGTITIYRYTGLNERHFLRHTKS